MVSELFCIFVLSKKPKDLQTMKNEEKELLLKDLSARLPYEVYVKDIMNRTKICKVYEINPTYFDCIGLVPMSDSYHYQEYSIDIASIRPYLRPMSSMTEEEKEEYHQLCDSYYGIYFDTIDSIDWLLKNHFDYRRLIGMGIALEAPDGMYN